MKKILVPIDGSECSHLAINQAVELAKKFDSKLTLLYVEEAATSISYVLPGQDGVHPTSGSPGVRDTTALPIPATLSREIERRGEGIMESALASCMTLGKKAEAIKLEGRAADVIIDHVKGNDYDLVIMGSYGMSGLRRFFMGSVTHKVALSIDIPIMIIR